MAYNEDAVRVGVEMKVYCAPEGTPLPTTLAALNAAFKEVGLIDIDGLEESLEVTTEILRAAQRRNGVRTLVTEVNWTWKFKAMETSPLVLELFYMGAESTTASGVTTTRVPGAPANTVKAWVIEVYDGDVTSRYVIERGDVTERGSVPQRGDAGTVYEMTVQVLANSTEDLGYRITDDPEMEVPAS